MQIVIDIDENVFTRLFDNGDTDAVDMLKACAAIRKGTPLPKGHGELIDRGELKTHFIGTEQGTDLEVYLEPTIINAPPIIKADTESEERE